jgi:hypothetical protein
MVYDDDDDESITAISIIISLADINPRKAYRCYAIRISEVLYKLNVLVLLFSPHTLFKLFTKQKTVGHGFMFRAGATIPAILDRLPSDIAKISDLCDVCFSLYRMFNVTVAARVGM